MADYSTTMLYNVLTVRNLLSACFKRLQGQLLRLTTLRCRDEATRTPDPYVPNVVRYQLRYIPILRVQRYALFLNYVHEKGIFLFFMLSIVTAELVELIAFANVSWFLGTVYDIIQGLERTELW